ncbi:hypothetical protein BDV23DRAFT_184231 [Aspergillus alliaceus]|uniref:Nudix hydrolase domain-containing protein n=1 Tax=Petromyces alliaceus TaxID=209559 RepID=A0A5N7C6D0_PETAA|nr:hypothetical protein BDV23DRAFT_184231 [Aspergillus alliaceus]
MTPGNVQRASIEVGSSAIQSFEHVPVQLPHRSITLHGFHRKCWGNSRTLRLEQSIRPVTPPNKCARSATRPGTTWLLPKGRRNCHESRHDAAVREITEEAGYACHTYSRDNGNSNPENPGLWRIGPEYIPTRRESFMLTVRELDDGSRVKMIWWYIDVLDEEENVSQGEFEAQFFSLQEALDRLTFDKDRKVLVRAIDVVKTCQAT